MISLEDLSIHHHHYQQTIQEECTGRNLEDKISKLPNDLLISILTRLTMKDAGKTSVLSKRWRHVWVYIPVLNFDCEQILKDILDRLRSVKDEEPKVVRWVNQVVSLHKAPTIYEFKVQFDMQEGRQDDVDNWVRYAIQKGVKRLHLDIAPQKRNAEQYTFPSLSFCNSLTSLRLSSVDVTGEVIEKLLHDCQALEHLQVDHSDTLVDLKVTSLNLKSLRIRWCFEIKVLQISAPNLVSLNYSGPKISSPFKGSLKLAQVSIGGYYGVHVMSEFSDLSSCSSKIEELSLRPIQITCIAKVFPVFARLNTLDIIIYPKSDEELFGLYSLINACPLLQKFVLEFDHRIPELEITENTRNIKLCSHNNLKIVEIIRFNGREIDVVFVRYLIEIALSLEKLSIELSTLFCPEEYEEERRRAAKRQAEQLHSSVKSGTQFEIIGEEKAHCEVWDASF